MMKNIYNGSNSPPSNIYRVVDGDTKKITKAWRAVSNTEYVKVWDIAENKNFIIKLAQITNYMSITINTSNLILTTSYEYAKNGTIDWGDGSSTIISTSTTEYSHTYDDSITNATVVIKSSEDILDFYSNFCKFENAEASIIIPNTITKINNSVFTTAVNDSFKNLVDVTIPDSVTSIGESAFEGCSKLKKLVIPNSVTVISKYMCKHCTSLEFVSAKKVQVIAPDAFSGCSSLSNIELDSVIAIYNSAFYDCSSLASITLPSSLKMLGAGSYAFFESTRDIVFGGTQQEWENVSKGNFWSRLLNTQYTVHCIDGNIDYTIIY